MRCPPDYSGLPFLDRLAFGRQVPGIRSQRSSQAVLATKTFRRRHSGRVYRSYRYVLDDPGFETESAPLRKEVGQPEAIHMSV